jgi:hypothetical protein
MTVSATFLASVASELRTLSGSLLGVEEQVGGTLTTAATNLEVADEHWAGPRSDAVLGAAGDYVSSLGTGSLGGVVAMIGGIRGVVDRWATSADEHASQLYGPEATLRTSALTPEDQEAHGRAQDAIADVESSWISASTSFAGEIDTYRSPLGTASTRSAFSPEFPYPPLEGTDYVTAVSTFAITSMVPIEIIDPSGQTERAAAARLDWLLNTETGRLIFTIIETAHERDIGESDEHWSEDDLLAACDPELVEAHIRSIYEEAGESLDDATLDLLVDETLAAAWSIRASRNDDWKERDEDLGFFEQGFGEWLREDFAGPAAAFVATAGCAGAVTVATGGVGAAAAGGCAVFGGAVGDSVSTWANGGDLGDIASAATNPQRRLLDFGTGFVTQGVLNRVLPASPTAPIAAAERGGVGPVLQGQAGVARTADDLVASGGRVFGEEVTVVTSSGARTRLDLYVELPNGQRAFLEVKTGASATVNPNQAAAFPQIISQGGTPVGANAAAAGLTPGTALGPTQVWVVHQPWPLPPP